MSVLVYQRHVRIVYWIEKLRERGNSSVCSEAYDWRY